MKKKLPELELAIDGFITPEQAGKLNSLTEDSLWIASAPKQDQIDLLKANPQLAQNWDEEYGDRINQLVFIGKNMNEEQIKRQFNDCLA